MTTNQLVKSFLDLSDEQKKSVIQRLIAEGYSKRDLEGLTWLATISNDTTKELMFNDVYARIKQ